MTLHALISEFARQTNRFYKTKSRIYVLLGDFSYFGQTPLVFFFFFE